jgi:hypothetical protein
MTAPLFGEVVHEIVGGFCRICGDTAEYLVDRGRDRVVFLDDVLIDTDVAPLGP